MKPNPIFTLPQDLPPDTTRALFDLFHSLADALRQQYGDQWNELTMLERNPYPATRQNLDFDDDIPF
jgi:hypothetical protein